MAVLIDDAKPAVFWSDRPDRPEALPALTGLVNADLTIIGGGFSGLWAALLARTQNPGREIVVVEAQTCGFGASSRNGGFCDASLTHGFLNGLSHWPDEIGVLERMGAENLDELIATCHSHQIDAGIERTGSLSVATEEWQAEELREYHELAASHGIVLDRLDADGVRAELNSDTFVSGLWDREGTAMVDPARLVWGLRRACLDLGVRIHEHSPVRGTERQGQRIMVTTEAGVVSSPKVLVATNAWAQPERAIRRYVVPIYDHVLMTEPLTSDQMALIGWRNRQGVSDSGNQFHYYRLTEDNRILWGGFDANYHRGNGMGPSYELRKESHTLIAGHFFHTFPQLEGLRFSHRWAGPIGTTSKFTAAFGTGHGGDLVWVAGYTGLGVGASRWGARTALDLVDDLESERTQLAMVRKKPMPFPPEPFRNPVIQFTRGQIAKADQNQGKQGPWLRFLSKLGVGFDS